MEMNQIAREAKVAPLRISFVMAIRLILDELIWCSLAKPGDNPDEAEENAGKCEANLSCQKKENGPKKGAFKSQKPSPPFTQNIFSERCYAVAGFSLALQSVWHSENGIPAQAVIFAINVKLMEMVVTPTLYDRKARPVTYRQQPSADARPLD